MTTKQYDNSQLVMCNDFLLGDILSRLPVKPLMRFKCVSKQWQSLIHKDRSFIDLHFTRSKASNFSIGGISLFIRWPRQKYFSSAKLMLSQGGGGAAVQREVRKPGAYLTHVFGGVNGLLALVNRSTNCVCIFNPSTGQSTPWIQPMFKQHDWIGYVNSNWYYFGYDPATMEHKVVLFWTKRKYNGRGDFIRTENVCDVMTVDSRQHNNNLSWRRIDDEFTLPPTISPSDFRCSLYTNGSIYWLRLRAEPNYYVTDVKEPLIVEFNVGSEKFRTISIPNCIIKVIRDYDSKLIQIDGRLAVLAKTTRCITNTPTMKMYKLYDNIGSVTSTSGAAGSTGGDLYWTEVTFMMPHSDWSHLQFDSIQAVPGADHLLIIKSEEEARSTFYFYDWSNKSFSKESFSIAKRKKPSSEYFVYEESLLHVI